MQNECNINDEGDILSMLNIGECVTLDKGQINEENVMVFDFLEDDMVKVASNNGMKDVHVLRLSK